MGPYFLQRSPEDGRLHPPQQPATQQPCTAAWLWVEQCSSADYPNIDFRVAICIGRAALGAAVAKENTALPVHEPRRGGATLHLSKRFGLTTCHKLVLKICTAITPSAI
ncbi:putative nuclease HARBI1 [Panicum miliaceum]|uniref:Nuclease HARBI1 n=1 Tax=Panicum miliaceum TaxID=4540 RepID=A0A3L6QEA1_PANMI|nr:putative nuclease HARBI1 [Panicum miliaceum]